MKFEEALIKVNSKEEIINREDVSRRKDFLEVIDNLYCPEQGCGARLVYNQRSTGVVYLSKHKSDEHDVNCPRFEDEEKKVKSITEFVEMNGGLTESGIQRRKKDSAQALFDYLNPPEKKKKKSTKKEKSTNTKTDDQSSTKKSIKVVYDPKSPVINIDDEGNEISVKEPPFYQRLPHEISVKDSGKNLKTSALIKELKISGDLNNPNAEISASFEGIKLTFPMPQAFFQDNKRNLNTDQLITFLEILKNYVEKNPDVIYLTTLCQSQKINLNEIVLNIYEPDFMSFQTSNGKNYDSLIKVVSAISTKAI